MSMPLAVQLYSVRDTYRENFALCIEKIAKIGYAGVECFGAPTLPAEDVASILNKHGLTLVGWHIGIDLLEGDALAETAAYLRAAGCPRAIVPGIAEGTFASRENILAFASRMTGVQEALATHGIALGYHNHHKEMIPLSDGTLPWALFMDHTRVIGQLDNGNAMVSKTPGLDTVALVAQWPGRATTVHAKPYSHASGLQTMIGEDDIDWPAFLSAAKEQGGAEWIIVEYEEETMYGQFEGVARCFEAIQKMMP